MTRTKVAVTAIALIATAATTAIAGGASATTTSAHTHTQHFHAKATAQLPTGKTSFVLAEQDVQGSTMIGHDVLFCRATRTHSTCEIAFAENGGLIYARFVLRDSDHTFHGPVTGGSGKYRGAHGTIAGRALSQSEVRVHLRYQV
jgi:hypothetical protein